MQPALQCRWVAGLGRMWRRGTFAKLNAFVMVTAFTALVPGVPATTMEAPSPGRPEPLSWFRSNADLGFHSLSNLAVSAKGTVVI